MANMPENRSPADTSIRTYRAKRDFTVTAEPPPREDATSGPTLSFVVPKHAARRAGLAFRSLPVPDFGVPDRAEFAGPLRELSDELTAGRHVAVHCWGGVGRSSLVAAALLVLRGSTAQAAWHRVAYARGVPVPETDEQRDWVARLAAGR